MKLTIEKLVYGGEGLARIPDNFGRAMTVFIPFVLPGEEVSAGIVEQKRSFALARLHEVLRPSAERIAAPCQYFQVCGGCQYQHTGYQQQLDLKTSILRETLARTAKLDWQDEIPAYGSDPFHYRNRTRMRVQVKAGVFVMGYYGFRSHRLLPVKDCPISSPLINRAITAMWALGEDGIVPTCIREIEFFANADDTSLLLEITVESVPAGEDTNQLENFVTKFAAALPEVKGASAFPVPEEDEEPASAWNWGTTSFDYRTANDSYRVSTGSFFQTNRLLTEKLVSLVCDGRNGKLALDLYAGVGLFSLPLARQFERVVAVESASSYSDLRANAIANVQPVHATTDKFLQHAGPVPDYVVVDPPRTGLGEKVARRLGQSGAADITYVSCDPATLSRDLVFLLESGYRVGSIDLVDLFPQTFHMETVVRLTRQ